MHRMRSPRKVNAGAMLVELMVGLAVSSIVIGAAIAALLVARDAAATVNELAVLQQDASHALRVLGLQVRTAGSNELSASPVNAGAFRFVVNPPAGAYAGSVHGTDGAADAGDSVTLVQTSPPLLASQQYDCLGQGASPGQLVEATFQVSSESALRCKSLKGKPQPLVAGVAAFKVRYRVRQGDQIRSLAAAEVEAAQLWPAVTALEVCLELQGEAHSAAFDASYVDCQQRRVGTGGRLRLVTRKLFSLPVQPKA